jgi:phytoene synthase
MTPADADAQCAAELRARDRDRWLAALWAREQARPGLVALFALDLELARVVASTTDPRIGEIRLAWWRERLEALDHGPPPAQPVLVALAGHVAPVTGGAALAGLEDGWLKALDGDAGGAARNRGVALFRLAARLLGDSAPEGLGEAWAVGEAAREGWRMAAPAPVAGAARALRPLVGLDRLGMRDAGRLARGMGVERRATPGRQLVLAKAAMLG